MAGCLVTPLRANPIATQEHLGWERGCQLLAVLGAGTNELKGFAVTGMNRNLAGFEYYSNINTDDPATAARLMHAGWEEGSKGVARYSAYYSKLWLTLLWVPCCIDSPWKYWPGKPFCSLTAALARQGCCAGRVPFANSFA
jgi:hypothetical protein